MTDRQYRPAKSKKHRNRGRGGSRNRPRNPRPRNHDIWIPPPRDLSPERRSIFSEKTSSKPATLFIHPDRNPIFITRRVSPKPSNPHTRSRSQSPVRKVQVVYAVSEGELESTQIRGIYGQRSSALQKADELMIDNDDPTREWSARGSDCWVSNGTYVEVKLWEVE